MNDDRDAAFEKFISNYGRLRLFGGYVTQAERQAAYEAWQAATNVTSFALVEFGLAVLEESRKELGDLDGGWLQDKAEALGLLMRVHVTEPCGEDCRCAECGGFPQDCLRYSDAVTKSMEKQ